MQAQFADERRSRRSKVMLVATVKCDDRLTHVRILDLSSHGALIVGDALPQMDSAVTLHCGTKSVAGWVAWRSGKQAGVNFGDQVTRQDFAPQASASHPVILNNHRADWRRPGFRSNQITVEEQFFLDQLLNDRSLSAKP